MLFRTCSSVVRCKVYSSPWLVSCAAAVFFSHNLLGVQLFSRLTPPPDHSNPLRIVYTSTRLMPPYLPTRRLLSTPTKVGKQRPTYRLTSHAPLPPPPLPNVFLSILDTFMYVFWNHDITHEHKQPRLKEVATGGSPLLPRHRVEVAVVSGRRGGRLRETKSCCRA